MAQFHRTPSFPLELVSSLDLTGGRFGIKIIGSNKDEVKPIKTFSPSRSNKQNLPSSRGNGNASSARANSSERIIPQPNSVR